MTSPIDLSNVPPEVVRWLEQTYGLETQFGPPQQFPISVHGWDNMVNTENLRDPGAIADKAATLSMTPGAVYTIGDANGEIDVDGHWDTTSKRGATDGAGDSGRTTLQVAELDENGEVVQLLDYRPGMQVSTQEEGHRLAFVTTDDDTWDNDDYIIGGDQGRFDVEVSAQFPTGGTGTRTTGTGSDPDLVADGPAEQRLVDSQLNAITYDAAQNPQQHYSEVMSAIGTGNSIRTRAGESYDISIDGQFDKGDADVSATDGWLNDDSRTRAQIVITDPNGNITNVQNFEPGPDGNMRIPSPGDGYNISVVVADGDMGDNSGSLNVSTQRLRPRTPAPSISFDDDSLDLGSVELEQALADAGCIPAPDAYNQATPGFWNDFSMPAFDQQWMSQFMNGLDSYQGSFPSDPYLMGGMDYMNGGMPSDLNSCGGLPGAYPQSDQAFQSLLQMAAIVLAYQMMMSSFNIPTEIRNAPAQRRR